jgi:hypothetical protein
MYSKIRNNYTNNAFQPLNWHLNFVIGAPQQRSTELFLFVIGMSSSHERMWQHTYYCDLLIASSLINEKSRCALSRLWPSNEEQTVHCKHVRWCVNKWSQFEYSINAAISAIVSDSIANFTTKLRILHAQTCSIRNFVIYWLSPLYGIVASTGQHARCFVSRIIILHAII